MAVAYHSILSFLKCNGKSPMLCATYDGPLVIAGDLMAWTVTKEYIQQREVVSAELVEPPKPSMEYMKAKRSGEAVYSDFVNSGKWEGFTPPPLPEN